MGTKREITMDKMMSIKAGMSLRGTSIENYLEAVITPNTMKNYRSRFNQFSEWALKMGESSLPVNPVTLATYLSNLAEQGKSTSTIHGALAAIAYAHIGAGYPTPITPGIKKIMKGIRNVHGAIATKAKTPLTNDLVKKMVDLCPESVLGAREKAILLLGFAGALRSSEISGLQVEDVSEHAKGLVIFIRKSKTDKERVGQKISIPFGSDAYCPVRAIRQYLKLSKIKTGPLFRAITRRGKVLERGISTWVIRYTVHKYVGLSSLNPRAFGAHSLRSGFITSAAENGANLFKIMDVSRHRSVETVRQYVRFADSFNNHAGYKLL